MTTAYHPTGYGIRLGARYLFGGSVALVRGISPKFVLIECLDFTTSLIKLPLARIYALGPEVTD